MAQCHDTDAEREGDWYVDEEFWRTFGPLMFGEEQFSEAAEQVRLLLSGIEPRPRRVLDLGAGPGRHALPLAEAGTEVTAVDTSALLLDELQRRAADLGVEIETVREDMRSFRRPGAFDLALVMWTSFGYFEDEDDHTEVLERIHENLDEDGLLVLDLVGLETLSRTLEPVHLTEYEDGRLLVERPALVDGMRRLENEWLLVDGDRVERTTFSHRVWSAAEIRRLLADHGFSVEAIDADFEGNEYDLEAERMIVFARKT
ncbi:MAG: class I SAM-dependent methyltransferase [Wenzhouxiangellaceae bacterium]|nr:class I SAM-dependent methyltransferase [Wenzhouxiangellaceae bacterium]